MFLDLNNSILFKSEYFFVIFFCFDYSLMFSLGLIL